MDVVNRYDNSDEFGEEVVIKIMFIRRPEVLFCSVIGMGSRTESNEGGVSHCVVCLFRGTGTRPGKPVLEVRILFANN